MRQGYWVIVSCRVGLLWICTPTIVLFTKRIVLEKLAPHNFVSWSTVSAGYAENWGGCFEQMRRPSAILPNAEACAGIGAIDKGAQFQDEILRLRGCWSIMLR
ncbi:hypothetical protein GOP47_0022144 [Adiantum capillus-veneris]|uniref:Uncharacterized protein n=1 Tax=Adiantum capillus-veneris TaxID=13818 RepID=A0A9D4U9N7_ADICA|nr:hypothetical protein GOP47_0022144 [Adiantum capillus-veneris]